MFEHEYILILEQTLWGTWKPFYVCECPVLRMIHFSLVFTIFASFFCFILLFNSRPSRNLCMQFDFCLLFVMQQHSKCNKRCSRKKRKQIFVSTDLSNIVLHNEKYLVKIEINTFPYTLRHTFTLWKGKI